MSPTPRCANAQIARALKQKRNVKSKLENQLAFCLWEFTKRFN